MRGQIEIYYNYGKEDQELLYLGDNMIVDGARAAIVDILTTSPDLSAGDVRILDASNYIPRAISFGKDAFSFSNNLHSLQHYLPTSGLFVPAFSGTTSSIMAPWIDGDIEASSINENAEIPSPLDLNLEKGLPGGQYLNSIQFSSTLGLELSTSIASGAYAPSDGITFTVSDTNSGDASGFTYQSAYNLRQTIDKEGFIHLVDDSTDPSGALIVSSNSDFSSTREVMYRTQMNTMDENLFRLYGGILSMGIWTINIPISIQTKALPLSLEALNLAETGITMRLFAKKTFSRNLIPLTRYIDTSTGNNLDIIWRINL